MCHTEQADYRGWHISIRCSRRAGSESTGNPSAFTAMAQAELHPGENPADWIDSRLQVISTGNRSFTNAIDSVRALLADVKEVIDALRR